jgi:2-phosphoglycerate kinase
MPSGPSGLLLLGTSHVGKSTCARGVGSAIGWSVISTDKLGRHPGRPWTGVPDPVTEFYLRLTDDAIHWFLRVHHENMRPVIKETIKAASEAGDGFILEGAALRPEYLPDWEIGEALVICLHAERDALRERIERESIYSQQSDQTKIAIDKFVERSVRENEALVKAAIRHKVLLVDVTDLKNVDRLTRELPSRLAGMSGR